MPIHQVQAPNGRIYSVEAPDNAPAESILAFAKREYEKDEAKRNKTATQDITTKLKQGIAQIPSSITGLLDLAVAPLAGGRPMVSEGWEKIGELTGIQPQKYADNLEYQLSPEYKQQQQLQQQAFSQPGIAGLLSGARETITNPRLLTGMLAESLPSTLAGGPLAKGAKLAPVLGEGLMTAGQMSSQLGQDNELTGKEVIGSLGAGVGTSLIGGLGNKLAGKLGGADIDTALTGGRNLTQAEIQNLARMPERGVLNRAARSAASEGLFEEPLQSMQEQAWQNYATSRPLTEGVGQAGVTGAILGGAMGGGFGAIAQDDVSRAKELAQVQAQQEAAERAQQRAPQLEALQRANATGTEPELVRPEQPILRPMEELVKTKEGVDEIIKNIRAYYPDYDKNELNIARQELRASKKQLPTAEEYRLQQRQAELETAFPRDKFAISEEELNGLGIQSRKVKQLAQSLVDTTNLENINKTVQDLNTYAESTGSVRGTEDALKAIEYLKQKAALLSPAGQTKLFPTEPLPSKEAEDETTIDGQPKEREPVQKKLFDTLGRPVMPNRGRRGREQDTIDMQGTERSVGDDVLAEAPVQPEIAEPNQPELGTDRGDNGGGTGGSGVSEGTEPVELNPLQQPTKKQQKEVRKFKNELKQADPAVEWDEMVDGEFDYKALRPEEQEAWEDSVRSGTASYDVAKGLAELSRRLSTGAQRAKTIEQKYKNQPADDEDLEPFDNSQLNQASNPDLDNLNEIGRKFSSPVAAAQWLSKNAKDESIRKVMNKVLPYLGHTKLVYAEKDIVIPRAVAREFYLHGALAVTNTRPSGSAIVYIAPDLKGSNTEVSLAHELLHAATTRRLMQPNLRAKFESLRQEFIARLPESGLPPDKQDFINTRVFNADEFLTYVMTSPTIKNVAKNMKKDGDSLWGRIVKFITGLFSVDKKDIVTFEYVLGGTSVKTELDSLLDELLQVDPRTVPFNTNENKLNAVSAAAQQQAQQLIGNMAGTTIRRAPTPTVTTGQAVRNAMRTLQKDPTGTVSDFLDKAYDTVAGKVVWRGAPLARTIQDMNNGAFRDAYNNVRPDYLMSQNENVENLIDATFTFGGIRVDNGLVTSDHSPYSVDNIFKAAKQLTDKLGPDIARQLITDTLYHWRASAIVQMGKQAYPKNWITNPSLVPTPAQIKAAMDAFNQFPELAEIRDQFIGSKNNIVQYLFDTGFLTKDKYDAYMNDNSYAPWFRIMEYEDQMKGQGNIGRVVNLSQMKSLKGGEEEVNDMLENMAQFIAWGVRSGTSNYTANNALRALTDLGQATKHNSVPSGVDPKRVVMTYENGKRVYWVPDNPMHFAALQAVPNLNSTLVKLFGKPAKLLRNAIVLFPTFPITQVIHDSFRAYAESGVNKPRQLVGEILRAFIGGDAYRGTHRDIELLKKYGVVGEVDYNIMDTTRGRVEKFNLDATKNPNMISKSAHAIFQHLHKFSHSADLAVRLGIYRQTMKETGDVQLAATRAREIINFRKAGTSQLNNALKQVVPFLGASLQGMDVLYRTATGRGNSMQERKLAFKGFMGNMMMLTAMTVLYTMMRSGDDEYEEQKGYVTDYNYMFPGGYLLPVPADIGLLFKVIPERLTDYLLSEGTDSPESSERLKEGLLAALARGALPPSTVSVITPLIEVQLNKSFFSDLPIVGREQEQYEKPEQYTESTSEIAIQLGKITGQSPMVLDHILRAVGGTSAGLITGTVDMFTGDRVARPKDPLLGRFYANDVGGRETEEFYAVRELVRRAEATAKKYEAEQRIEDLTEYVGREEIQTRLGLTGMVQQVEEIISEARKAKQAIRNDESLTPEERREQIDAITEQIEQYMRMINIRGIRSQVE